MGEAPGKSKIADFKSAVRIDEDVAGFEIPVDDLGWVKVLHALENLVHNVAVMQIFEDLLSDSVVEISLHEFEYQIEIFVILGPNDIVHFDDVGVGQFMQIYDLAIGSLGVDRVLKGIEYFFQGQGLVCFAVDDLPNVSVCTWAHLLGEGIAGQYVMFNFFCHFLWLVDLNIISMECKYGV